FESWRWSFYLDRGVFRRLDAILSAFYGEGEYTGTNIEDTLTGASAVLSYDLSQRIKINLGYYLSRTSSNVAEREYTKNRVYLGANLIY
ncbi:MAG: outer membrane beta-barrel protein, partial [Candidatus Omnitrophica bacterium]|nr:outer membrane beta-barrel protein [Candidatus Omnitrophota bacterium]